MPESKQSKGPRLRERKKAKTRATIQQHALRLIQAHSYDATTVEQIAEAAEISPSTFFRYFPTKEDVVLYDELDPQLIAAFAAQPSELSPVQAMRATLRAIFARLGPEEVEQQHECARLVLAVPELRMHMLDQLAGGVRLMAELLAKRTGRRADDLAVQAPALRPPHDATFPSARPRSRASQQSSDACRASLFSTL
jgi:AcrR family transcriptional regulator